MDRKNILIKIIYIVGFFMVETLFQILCFTLVINLSEKQTGINFVKAFLDVGYYIGSLKVVFFLPVYLLYYLIAKNTNKNFVLHHFLLHLGCLAVIDILLIRFVSGSVYGLILSILGIVISTLISYVFNFFFNGKLQKT